MPVPTTPDNSLEFWKVAVQGIGYVITWVIVVTGWMVSNGQNRTRDQRKELRDQISNIAEGIRNVEADVVSFLTCKDGSETASYWTIYFGVRSVNAAITQNSIFDTVPINKALIEYRQSITDRAVSGPTSARKSAEENDTALKDVGRRGNHLVRQLETLYSQRYPFKG